MDKDSRQIGLLHPGDMGSALAAVLLHNGHVVRWVGDGRSKATTARAMALGLADAGSMDDLCRQSDILISICPPHAAVDVAQAAAAGGFSGLYVDANAIAPDTAGQVAAIMGRAGASYVDAAIIGPPPGAGRQSSLFLSGEAADEVAGLFASPWLWVEQLGTDGTQASALKICHSALNKGQFALLLAMAAAAEHFGVRGALEQVLSRQGLVRRSLTEPEALVSSARKGWRFAGEMQEVAAALSAAGLPAAMHQGASEVFARLPLPEQAPATLEALIKVLLNRG